MPGTTLGTAYVQIMPSTKGMGEQLSSLMNKEAGPAGESAGKSIGGNLVGALKGIIAAAGIGKLLKDTLEAGANLQQSFGGLDTLYGDAADAAKQYAMEAAAAGISANDYAEQAVSFGAALKDAFSGDTAAAAEAANTAIMDMADNAAKMGTDIGSLQTAYQGFAKQNYTMLDNLKLGYGGTKTEMERLLKDAEQIHLETTGEATHYDINNLGDVYAAIHDVQENLGLTGVAADEAATTFSGSLGSMKASAENLMANLALGEDIGPSLDQLTTSVGNFLTENLFPMVGNILSELPGLLGQALTWAFDNIPNLIDTVINFINNLTSSLTDSGDEVGNGMQTIAEKALDMFKEIDWAGLGSAVIDLIVTSAETFGPVLWEGIQTIAQTAWDWFKEVDWLQLGQDVLQLVLDAAQTFGPILWDGIKSIAQTAWDWFKEVDWLQLGEDVLNLVIDGLKAIGSFLWDTMKEIGTQAWDDFTSIDWLGLGSNIINGIVDGLNSAGQAIVDTLTGWAQSAWEGAKNFLGIKSPSRLFRDTVGKMIPLGMAEGVDDEGDAVTDAINGIAKDAINDFELPGSMNINASGAAGGLNDNSNVNINVYAAPGMDINALAEQIQYRLAQVRRQERAAMGYLV